MLRLAGGAAIALPFAFACGLGAGGGNGAGGGGSGSTGALLRSAARLPEPFGVPLPLPPVLEPVHSDATTDTYEITQKAGQAAILPGLTTEVWGYNGIFPGPTIETRRGRQAVVRHRNELPVPTVVHLHGGVTPPEHDGYPTDVVLPAGAEAGHIGHAAAGALPGPASLRPPGSPPPWACAAGAGRLRRVPDPVPVSPGPRTGDPLARGAQPGRAGRGGIGTGRGTGSQGVKDYVYPLDQPAATLWYHDHRMDFTGPQVYRGLAGFHLVRDAAEDALPLPKGERDIPLMICDRSFAEDGSFRYPSLDPTLQGEPGVTGDFMQGVLGDVILVNGAAWPYLEVTNTRYRFRILNASNARRYRLALDPPPREGPAFVQIGSDVGLLGRPVSHEEIEIAPAERFEVLVDFSTYPLGAQVTLANRFGAGTTGQVMRFHVARQSRRAGRQARDDSAVPSRLVEVEPLTRSDASVTRMFVFARGAMGAGGRPGTIWTINGQPFDPQRVDAQPRLGAAEIWRLATNVHHPVHLHLAHFQVLTRNGRQPGPYDAGWKDTIDLQDGETAEIIARFTGFRGRYVFHCHNLEHEDMMMMGNLQVI
jgi:spore coat protein A